MAALGSKNEKNKFASQIYPIKNFAHFNKPYITNSVFYFICNYYFLYKFHPFRVYG